MDESQNQNGNPNNKSDSVNISTNIESTHTNETDKTHPPKKSSQPTKNEKKKLKKKGPFRSEAIIPITIVTFLFWAYFYFFFDIHLKKALEFGGFQIIGGQVDIFSLKTSFLDGKIKIQNIEITNNQKPTHNMVTIEEIRFGILWDALLRGKLVINEMAVEGIGIDSIRKTPGKIKKSINSNLDNSKYEKSKSNDKKNNDDLKQKALNILDDELENSAIENVVALINGSNTQNEISKIEGELESKKKLIAFEAELKEKSKEWNERLKKLPQEKDFKILNEKLNKIKIKDFKSPQELQQSLSDLNSLIKEADAHVANINSTSESLQNDLKKSDSELKEIKGLIESDINHLKEKFKIPSIDGKKIAKALLFKYLAPYKAQFNHYANIFNQYAPPNLLNNTKNEDSIKPHKRSKGVTYEFPQKNSYPLFWIKKISISSVAQPSKNLGHITGLITNITSNQSLIDSPTKAELSGDFPSKNIFDIKALLVADFRDNTNLLNLDSKIGRIEVKDQNLIDTKEMSVGWENAKNSPEIKITIENFKNINANFKNHFSDIKYKTESPQEVTRSTFQTIFNEIPSTEINLEILGQLPQIEFFLYSNFGEEIEKSLKKLLASKLQLAEAQVNEFVNSQIGSSKNSAEKLLNANKLQADSELDKVKTKIEEQKKKLEEKIKTAQTDFENRAKKGLENELNKALGGNGKTPSLDDLKKKLKF